MSLLICTSLSHLEFISLIPNFSLDNLVSIQYSPTEKLFLVYWFRSV